MHFFGGDQRKTLAQIEAHLVAKHAARARAGAVGLLHPMRVDMAHEIFVGRWDGVGGRGMHGRELKGLAFRHCEERSDEAVKCKKFSFSAPTTQDKAMP